MPYTGGSIPASRDQVSSPTCSRYSSCFLKGVSQGNTCHQHTWEMLHNWEWQQPQRIQPWGSFTA